MSDFTLVLEFHAQLLLVILVCYFVVSRAGPIIDETDGLSGSILVTVSSSTSSNATHIVMALLGLSLKKYPS